MSRSPRKVLRTAADALEALNELCERYPDAAAEINRALGGVDRAATVEAARRVLRNAVVALDTPEAPARSD